MKVKFTPENDNTSGFAIGWHYFPIDRCCLFSVRIWNRVFNWEVYKSRRGMTPAKGTLDDLYGS
jgi:hypothetical protein